jgi:hypothetical protein
MRSFLYPRNFPLGFGFNAKPDAVGSYDVVQREGCRASEPNTTLEPASSSATFPGVVDRERRNDMAPLTRLPTHPPPMTYLYFTRRRAGTSVPHPTKGPSQISMK